MSGYDWHNPHNAPLPNVAGQDYRYLLKSEVVAACYQRMHAPWDLNQREVLLWDNSCLAWSGGYIDANHLGSTYCVSVSCAKPLPVLSTSPPVPATKPRRAFIYE